MENREEFNARVSADARSQLTDIEHRELWVDDNIDDIYDTLVELKKDVEMQMTNFKARMAHEKIKFQERNEPDDVWRRYYAQELHWRARALKFLRSLETRINEAKQARRERHEDILDDILPGDTVESAENI